MDTKTCEKCGGEGTVYHYIVRGGYSVSNGSIEDSSYEDEVAEECEECNGEGEVEDD